MISVAKMYQSFLQMLSRKIRLNQCKVNVVRIFALFCPHFFVSAMSALRLIEKEEERRWLLFGFG